VSRVIIDSVIFHVTRTKPPAEGWAVRSLNRSIGSAMPATRSIQHVVLLPRGRGGTVATRERAREKNEATPPPRWGSTSVGENQQFPVPPTFVISGALHLPLSRIPQRASSMATISAGVQYAKWLKLFETEVPFQSYAEIPEDAPDQRKTNLEFETRVESFEDLRSNLESFNLDEHGFMVKQEPLPFTSEFFAQRDEVEKLYFAELERVVREICGKVNKVHFFDWRVRFP
jgi:hypothetical protein